MPPAERQFSLVLALLATKPGLLKHEILSTVRGYADDYVAGGDNASLERRFERDKDDLREAGMPVETLESPDHPGDNQHLRYRIAPTQFNMPDDIEFSADERTLLALAAEVWRDGSLSDDSTRAMTKLRALGAEPIDPVIGVAPRVQVREPGFNRAERAIRLRRTIRFRYFKPGTAGPTEREIDPYQLLLFEGRWHLLGFDHWAKAPRTFLLRRIVGDITELRRSFDEPAQSVLDAMGDDLRALANNQIADVQVRSESDAETQLVRRAIDHDEDAGVIRLQYTDEAIFADELASYGPEIRVYAPTSLVAAVRDRLTAVAAAHGGAN